MPINTAGAERQTAAVAGIFFIIATAFLFLGEFFYRPILNAADYLEIAHPERAIVVLGVLIEFTCVLAIPLIAVVLFPILKRYSEAMALAYVVFRTLEAAILISVAEVNKLSLIGLSEDYLVGGGADASVFRHIGDSILAANAWGDTAGLLYLLVFVVGALILYAVLYWTRLIPRVLSGWGVLSALVLGGVALAAAFVEVSPTLGAALITPLALQEMVMAAWLIVKGFDGSAIAAMTPSRMSAVDR